VYGKTIQNVRDYIEVKLHTTAESALKAASNPTFKNYSIIDENLVQTNHFPVVIKHNTPIAIGVTILELVSILIRCVVSFINTRYLWARSVLMGGGVNFINTSNRDIINIVPLACTSQSETENQQAF